MEARLNKAFQAAIDEKRVPAAGGIILNKSGEVLWSGAFGTTNVLDANAPPYTLDTQAVIFSCTKLVTSILALQLVDEGKLSLDDPVEKWDPDFAKIKVLDGFDENGSPKFREPKSKATVLHLLTHTAGLAYDFFNEDMLKVRIGLGQQPATTMSLGIKENYKGPLMFDPGHTYEYGMNTDWVGFVVEAVTGKRIADVMNERIWTPLGLKNSGRVFDEQKSGPRQIVHAKLPEPGQFMPIPDIKPLDNPEVNGGGEFMISTIADYSQILLCLLNDGKHPTKDVRILQPGSVKKYLFTDLISDICSPENVGMIPSCVPQLSNTGEMLPGIKKTWSAALLLNETDNPTGRPAGSGAWAGLANTYYWVDTKTGKLGMFNSSVLPFYDTESLYLFDEMERATYGFDAKKNAAENGGNYGPWDGKTKAAL